MRSIEGFNEAETTKITAGKAAGFTLEQQIYITRGQIAVRSDQKPSKVARRLRVNLFWMGHEPLSLDKDYYIKIGTAKVACQVEEITRVIDASNLNAEAKKQVERHDVAEVILNLRKAISFDLMQDVAATSRFVIVDDYEIRGGGIIREELTDAQGDLRDNVLIRNQKWETGLISQEERWERNNLRSTLVILTGSKDKGKKNYRQSP